MLIDALQLLAADAADQIRAFPSFVCIADEIALTFNDAVLLCLQNAEEDGTPEWLVAAVKEIDEKFDALSGSVAPDFWTAAALEDDVRWQELRGSARKILGQLGAVRTLPTVHAVFASVDEQK
ncbi:MAG TPA: hypothetical protein VE010_04595 [Thermoanaerobaculia bacterium]|nr:hypothetical protein [Thermoanaerobaculia bacterium]